ncbi:MAG: hypothetical protein KDA76_17780 [Planctomycetaceae bacterium]|nr:hypothetical protein [Planctomycetaceae bacterium]
MAAAPPPSTPPMPTVTVDLKTPWLAALLSWAIPGAGQIYQKRYFKGILFLVCILGMFGLGINMGEGRPVYVNYYVAGEGGLLKKRNYGYLSQMLVGAAAMPAIIQSSRFESEENTWRLTQPIDEPFEGVVRAGRDVASQQAVRGRISLNAVPGSGGQQIEGHLVGTLVETGEPIDLKLSQPPRERLDSIPVGLRISADPKRHVQMWVDQVQQGPEGLGENLIGSVARPLRNWYQVPLQDNELQDLNGRLGKRWELAMVLTWLAGLLNILAIWDAFEGPAYGIRPATARGEDREPPGPAPQ